MCRFVCVVLLPADGVADDDRDPLGIDRPLWPASVQQCGARGRDRPLLAVVELRRRPRAVPAASRPNGSQANSRTQPPMREYVLYGARGSGS